MSRVIDNLERANLRESGVSDFDAGDRVKVHFQVVEGTRRRTQVFEGVVIKRQGGSVRETFTVRKQSFGVGVERTFPLHSPKVERVEVVSRGDVRRAKLYYLRGRVGRRARVRERQYAGVERPLEAAGSALDERGPQEDAAVVAPASDEEPVADATGVSEGTEAGEPESPGEEGADAPVEAEETADVEGEAADPDESGSRP